MTLGRYAVVLATVAVVGLGVSVSHSSTGNLSFLSTAKDAAEKPVVVTKRDLMRLAQILPPGSYQGSCNSCQYDGTTLRCNCKASEHGCGVFSMGQCWNWSSIIVPACPGNQHVFNRGGTLTCGDG